MTERVWNFGRDVLNQRAAQGDVQQLRSAADCEEGKAPNVCCLDQGDLRPVSLEIGNPALGAPGLSIERRLYIFAACKEETVDSIKYEVDGIFARERWYNYWYDACTFECGDVCVIEPYSVRPILKIRSCRYCDNSA